MGDTLVHLSAGEVVRFEFNFPSELCGRLIGRGGKNIQHIKEQSGATVTLSSNPFTPEFQVCRVQGSSCKFICRNVFFSWDFTMVLGQLSFV